jgi:hypothetical protein
MVNNLREFVSEIEIHGKSVYGLAYLDMEMTRHSIGRGVRYDANDKEEIEFAVKDFIRKNGFGLQVITAKMDGHNTVVFKTMV